MEMTSKIDGCHVRITTSCFGRNGFELRGRVSPYQDRFHGVSFSVKIDRHTDEPTYDVGFGGNTFAGPSATKMVRAAVIAEKQAVHYAAMLEEAVDSKEDPSIITQAMEELDYQTATILIEMTPDMTSQKLARKLRNGDADARSPYTYVTSHPSFQPVLEELKSLDLSSEIKTPAIDLAFSLIEQGLMKDDPYKDIKDPKQRKAAVVAGFISSLI